MVPMIIVVRVGLDLAYQGASSTPYRYDPSSSSARSFGRRKAGQLSTFKAASQHTSLNKASLVTSSSGTKLDTSTETGTDSRVRGDELNLHIGGSSGEKNSERKME
jgi:hypothetical protein